MNKKGKKSYPDERNREAWWIGLRYSRMESWSSRLGYRFPLWDEDLPDWNEKLPELQISFPEMDISFPKINFISERSNEGKKGNIPNDLGYFDEEERLKIVKNNNKTTQLGH